MINEGGIIWKTKEEMNKIELLHLKLGYYLTGYKPKNKPWHYRIN